MLLAAQYVKPLNFNIRILKQLSTVCPSRQQQTMFLIKIEPGLAVCRDYQNLKPNPLTTTQQ